MSELTDAIDRLSQINTSVQNVPFTLVGPTRYGYDEVWPQMCHDVATVGTAISAAIDPEVIEALEVAAALVPIADEIVSVAGVAGAIPTVAVVNDEVAVVAAIAGPVIAVANIGDDVATVATNATDVSTAATNIAAIIAAPAAAATAAASRMPVTRSELKAIDSGSIKSAILGEDGRQGTFLWRSGDYSSEVTADTEEAIFIKADAIAASAGAWVRQDGWRVKGILANWFGVGAVALQAALSLASALGVGHVFGDPAAYVTSSTISVPADVKLFGNHQATIKQADGANLTQVVSLGDGAHLLGVIVDGNWDNNPAGDEVAVRIGNSDDCVVESCVIKNCPGYGIVVNHGLMARIRLNTVFNFYQIGIAAFGNNVRHDHEIIGNRVHTIGWAGILVQDTDHFTAARNTVTGQIIGGRDARLTVNTSGTTVTWVSGPNFADVMPGNWAVVNSGAEFRIASVDSPTQLTMEATLPTLSGVNATVGSGDLLGVIACNNFTIDDNEARSTATFGMAFSLASGVHNCSRGTIAGNRVSDTGKTGVPIYGATAGSGKVIDLTLIGNKVVNAGYGAGIGSSEGSGFYIAGSVAGNVADISFIGNTVWSFAGSGQTTYWLAMDTNMNAGTVLAKGNTGIGLANDTIQNDVKSIVLGAGWGSTASTAFITSNGEAVQFQITCAGTGYAASPPFTISKVVDTGASRPTAKIVSTGGGSSLADMWGEWQSSRGAWVAHISATPASGHVYLMIVKE